MIRTEGWHKDALTLVGGIFDNLSAAAVVAMGTMKTPKCVWEFNDQGCNISFRHLLSVYSVFPKPS